MSEHQDAHGEGHHDHPAYLQHHFDTPQQQFSSGKMGMWLFLATEVLLFGGLFVAYSVYRSNHPEVFIWASKFLDTKWGAINTAVLITSSLSMAWGVRASQLNQRGLLVGCLLLTLCGGAGFMGIKFVEYKAKFEHGMFPGSKYYPDSHYIDIHDSGEHGNGDDHTASDHDHGEADGHAAHASAAPAAVEKPFSAITNSSAETVIMVTEAGIKVERSKILPARAPPEGLSQGKKVRILGPEPDNVHTFFSVYFGMTGLHALHVIIGMLAITWVLIRTLKGHFGTEYFTPVDLVGLYWHLVDLIWIFLFPLLYLIG